MAKNNSSNGGSKNGVNKPADAGRIVSRSPYGGVRGSVDGAGGLQPVMPKSNENKNQKK